MTAILTREIRDTLLNNVRLHFIDERAMGLDPFDRTYYLNLLLTIDGAEFEFSDGFTELHKQVYDDVLNGRGYGLEDAKSAIAIAEKLRMQ